MGTLTAWARAWRRGLAAAGLCLLTTAHAAPPPARPFEDTLAQRLQACTVCHGAEGRAAPDGYYPRIAGKPAGYLYHQLLNFREGRRHYRLMVQMVDPLDDAYLWTIAEHFAGLNLPYPPPTAVRQTPAERARGERLARQGDAALGVPACIQCHGARLTGRQPHVPGLLGLPRDYLTAQVGAWRTGLRRAHAPDCMHTIAERLGPEDVAAVAGWLASQPLPADTRPDTPGGPLPMACGPLRTPATAAAGGGR
ncbi:cytochrome C [Tepidimonas fonticaldi]|uniref:Cytochrome C n=1 Tax=Tepidimonas fonticaldi TaxID=1101373 RepID=A0A1A6DXZ5_9BURK|nr:c-type cytochrome [Tepidimonas fonticaldi]OBS31634.1 cytochrome C [Tepidimonas fonticaldi]